MYALFKNRILPLIATGALITTSHLGAIPYFGTIVFPSSLKTPECPGVYCNGFALETEIQSQPYAMASFELAQKKSLVNLSFLFMGQAATPTCSTKQNIPSCLKITPNTEYKFVELSQTEVCTPTNKSPDEPQELSKCFLTWNITEKKLTDNTIPQDTIIVLLDPALVTLENTTWDILDNYVPLPKITIKNDENIGPMMARLQFARCTMNSFHQRTKSNIDVSSDCNKSSLTIRKTSGHQCL